MGMSAKAVAMYGLYFSSEAKLKTFIKEHYPEVEDYEYLETRAEVLVLDYYSGSTFVLGYHVPIGVTLEKYQQYWKEDFPNSKEEASPQLRVILS